MLRFIAVVVTLITSSQLVVGLSFSGLRGLGIESASVQHSFGNPSSTLLPFFVLGFPYKKKPKEYEKGYPYY